MRKNLADDGARILFVDDEAILVSLAREMLTDLGHQVTACSSGPEALEIFRDRPADFDLLITDLMMPDLPGDQLAEEVLAIRSDLPVILVTGIGEDEGADKARASGIRNLLAKPHTVKELRTKIRDVLSNLQAPSGDGA